MTKPSDTCILIHCALPIESQALAQSLKLKRATSTLPFKMFEASDITLVCSGVGRIASAAAVSSALTIKAEMNLFAINFGFAAGPDSLEIGSPVLAHKITDQSIGKTFFPDMTIQHSFQESSLVTVDTPATADTFSGAMVDMEASGFYGAASSFLPSSRIAVLKVISDHFSDDLLSKSFVNKSISEVTSAFEQYLDNVRDFLKESSKTSLSIDDEYLSNVYGLVNFTVTQKSDFESALKSYIIRNKGNYPELKDYLKPTNSKKDQNILHSRIMATLVSQ